MKTEPLTVEELERCAEQIWRDTGLGTLEGAAEYLEHITGLLTELIESHSRQLWLEAAEMCKQMQETLESFAVEQQMGGVATALTLESRFRAKGESHDSDRILRELR